VIQSHDGRQFVVPASRWEEFVEELEALERQAAQEAAFERAIRPGRSDRPDPSAQQTCQAFPEEDQQAHAAAPGPDALAQVEAMGDREAAARALWGRRARARHAAEIAALSQLERLLLNNILALWAQTGTTDQLYRLRDRVGYWLVNLA
jgi:hypothetical protein